MTASPPPARDLEDSPVLQRQRSRRLFWKIIAGMVMVVVLLIAGIYIKAFWNSPEPTVDYLAQLNAPILAIPEEDRAWPIYREAIIRYKMMDMAMYPGEGKKHEPAYVPTDSGMTLEEIWGSGSASKGSASPATPSQTTASQPTLTAPSIETQEENYTGRPERIKPGEKRWPQAAAAMDAHAGLYEAIRQAGRKPALGLHLAHVYSGEDALAFPPLDSSNLWYDPLQDGSLIHLLLPFMGRSRTLARIIALDVHYAAHQKDWPRVVANMQAISDLAKHLHHPRLLLHDLVSISLAALWMDTYSELHAEHAHEIPDQTLAELAGILRSWPKWDAGQSNDEILYVKDELQRTYGPNGQLTYQGLKRMHVSDFKIYEHPMFDRLGIEDEQHTSIALAMLLPVLVATTASHDETLKQYQHMQRLQQLDAKTPLWDRLHTPGMLQKQLDAWEADAGLNDRYWLVTQMTRLLPFTLNNLQASDAWREAYITAIALERHHRKHGRYPSSLQDLVPDFLDEHPVDHTTGQPLLYKIVDDKPLLYGRGLDGDDDGGKLSPYGKSSTPASDHDWILFPMPE